MREKLIELVNNVLKHLPWGEVSSHTAEDVADHLAENDVVQVVLCEHCEHGSHVDTPEGRVWCERLCRYMVVEGYCSYGKRK